MNAVAILAYSGGLDTTLSLKKLINDGFNVITVTINIGNERNWDEVRKKALSQGACEALVFDLREEFADDFIAHSLRGGVLYDDKYPLATALARPLMAKKLAEVALDKSARTVAHGCSGKGNDQLRFEHTIKYLYPRVNVAAPIREGQVKRSLSKEYQESLNARESEFLGVYSIDENIWGRSIECGVLEDAWEEAPEEIYKLTNSIDKAPAEGLDIEIDFVEGLPVALNGISHSFLETIEMLNKAGGRHGVGRIDMIENRVVGIKSREIYEAPGAVILHTAHSELESLTLSKSQIRLKRIVSSEYADLIYQGFWYTSMHKDILTYVRSTQSAVSGKVKIRVKKGHVSILGRQSDFSLYDQDIASYEKFDGFDSDTAVGFIQLHGLESSVQMKKQRKLIFSSTKNFKRLSADT